MTKVKFILTSAFLAISLTACTHGSSESKSDYSVSSPIKTVDAPSANTGVSDSEVLQMEAVTLYEVDVEAFSNKTTQIPSYSNGKISYWANSNIKSFNEGHNVSWSDPLLTTMTGITNLIQYDYTNDKTVNEQLRKIKGSTLNQTITITTESGVSFTKNPYDKKSNSTTIEAKTPKNGTYFITLENGNDSDIQIIQKIVFKKGIENVNKALTIYSLPENILQNKITEIPYYAFGKISYITEKDIQSVNEGHSPWKTTPLLAAEILTTNLIPKNVDKKQVSYVVTHESNSKKANEVTVVEMKVPGFGVYNITLRYPDKSPISFITQITFEPSYDFQP